MSRIALAWLVTAALGCSSTEGPAAPVGECDARVRIDGICPGDLTTAAICGGADCTGGVTCASVIMVDAPAELAAKAAGAKSGACIILAAATYPAVTLPAGVSLFGRGSSSTKIAGIATTGGKTATLRGMLVAEGGIDVVGPGKLEIDRVIVRDGDPHGIHATDTNLRVHATTIEGPAGTSADGIFVQCAGEPCSFPPQVDLDLVRIRNVGVVGLWTRGAQMNLRGVEIVGIRKDAKRLQYGRGFEADAGADITATGLVIKDCRDVGMLVDFSDIKLSNFLIAKNQRGVQLQGTKVATLENFEITDNLGVGITLHRGAAGVVIQNGRVASTTLTLMPTDVLGESDQIGDGIEWLGGSHADIKSTVTIEGSGRRAAIVSYDAAAPASLPVGSFEAKLLGDDATKGLVVQGGSEAKLPAGLAVNGVTPIFFDKSKSLRVTAMMPTTP